MQIILSQSPEALFQQHCHATVEAEYGNAVVQGTILTLAHHGDRKNRPCPCSLPNLPEMGIERIGISHFDLDTLGGIMAIMGCKPERIEFWAVGSWIDIQGPHKANQHSQWKGVIVEQMNAWWAWSESNRCPRPEKDMSLDVTEYVLKAIEVLTLILNGRESYLNAGIAWAEKNKQLNNDSFTGFTICKNLKIAVRNSDNFVNHLYELPNGNLADGVLAFNSKFNSITLSFSDGQGDACAVMQNCFGPLAGGHRGIAGSPRGQVMTQADLHTVLASLEA